MDQQHPDRPGRPGPESTASESTTVDETVAESADVEGSGPEPDDPTTGVAEVDAVLASLEGLEDRPVAEHVELFEKAHERLRRALDTPAD